MTIRNEELRLEIAVALEESGFNPDDSFSEEYFQQLEDDVLAATGSKIASVSIYHVILGKILADMGITKTLHVIEIEEAVRRFGNPILHHSLRLTEYATELMLYACTVLTQLQQLEDPTPYIKGVSLMVAKVDTDYGDKRAADAYMKLARYNKCIEEALEDGDFSLMLREFFGPLPEITKAEERALMHMLKVKASYITKGKFYTPSYITGCNTVRKLTESGAASA